MTENSLYRVIRKHHKENDVVLYMLGTKENPNCSVNAHAVEILQRLVGDNFKAIDVWGDDDLAWAVKCFNNYADFPQIVVKGIFYGGCLHLMDMEETGELLTLLKKKPHKDGEP